MSCVYCKNNQVINDYCETCEVNKLRAENAELREQVAFLREESKKIHHKSNWQKDRLEDASRVYSENAELRERLAEAEKQLNTGGTMSWREYNQHMIEASNKLAATEALLAEWVAWGKFVQSHWPVMANCEPPMPKERVE